MKKRLIGFGTVVLLLGLASSLHANGIINKQNQSADFVRTLNRNAAYDSADAAIFNPAGVMRMQNGMYVRADVIYFDKTYGQSNVHIPFIGEFGNMGSFESTKESLLPTMVALYKQDRWAGFFTLTIPGGGGKVKYYNGNTRTAMLGTIFSVAGLVGIPFDQYLQADAEYRAYTLGGAYKISDSLAVAGGVRYVDAYQKFSGYASGTLGEVNVYIKRTDEAWNYFLGLNYAPIKDLNIGFLYQSNTPLNFVSEAHDNVGGLIPWAVGWANGSSCREDLPGYLAFGVSYFIIPNKLKIETNLTVYLEKSATLEQPAIDGNRFRDNGNSYDYGLAVEYIFNPKWKVSMGYLRTDIRGMSPDDALPEAAELDANTLALGAVYSPNERLSFILGGLRVWYDSDTKRILNARGPVGTELEKKIIAVSFGLQYRFF
jgi:long-chain fatty acid transport protein